MRHTRNDIPYSWFWFGKPIYKGYYRGERIRPVLVSDTFAENARSSRVLRGASPAEKPSHSRFRCGMHNEKTRPPTPNSSEATSSSSGRKCCSCCPLAKQELETFSQVRGFPCESGSGVSTPSTPGHSHLRSTPAMGQSPGHCHHEFSSQGHTVAASSDHFHDCHHSGSVRNYQQAESASNKTPEVKCTSKSCGPPPSPETSHGHHCCHSDNCHDTLFTTNASEDTRSEFSVEPTPQNDRDECRCGRLFLAIPVVPVGVEFLTE
ncbi:hypothetical protein N7495_004031 [Penicillium taxi]|uniref:uncharacterized protein n=1 Tax=Penicillium taxi TaxID=168475 RepID=UPI002545ACB4|nr:uncharacterized protein N7495_004031 [Penicillium taxi]KAJ5899287.1 hypothetical protein N7495_004031 [Penicillium taxi]